MRKVGGPMKNMGGPIKLLFVIMFEILKCFQKCIFGPVKHEKFLQRLYLHFTKYLDNNASLGRVTQICATNYMPTLVYISALDQIMAWRQQGNKPLSDPMLKYCWLAPQEQTSVKFLSKFIHFHFKKIHLKISSAKWWLFCVNLNVIHHRSLRFTLKRKTGTSPFCKVSVMSGDGLTTPGAGPSAAVKLT